MADEDDVPRPPQFELDEHVIMVDATARGSYPRVSDGRGPCRVMGFDVRTRMYTLKPLSLYSRGLTQVPESALRPRDFGPDMTLRNGNRSSEAAKLIVAKDQQIAVLKRNMARREAGHGAASGRDAKKLKTAAGKVTTLEARVVELKAEMDHKDPRLSFRGHCLARTLTSDARGGGWRRGLLAGKKYARIVLRCSRKRCGR